MVIGQSRNLLGFLDWSVYGCISYPGIPQPDDRRSLQHSAGRLISLNMTPVLPV